MELEEAIERLNNLKEDAALFSTGWKDRLEDDEKQAIETVLQELESYKRRYELAIEQNIKDYKNSISKKEIEEKKKYKLLIRKYNLLKNDYEVIEQTLETNDIYHEIGYIYCTTIEDIKRIDYQLLEDK